MASIAKTHALFLFLTLVFKASLQQCPSECMCPSGTEVLCINKGLSAIPPNIPATVEKLHLDGNSISEVNNSDISAFSHLKELYLPRNNLRTVPGQTFANMPNLEILHLASNNISFVDNDAFQNSPKLKYIFLNKNSLVAVPAGLERLENLQILALDSNNIRTVNASFFSSLRSIRRIDLNNNPWLCDCHLRGLKEWMVVTSAEIFLRENVTCASPEHLIDQAIDDVHVDDMVCTTPATMDSATTKVTKTTTTTTGVGVYSSAYSSPSARIVTATGRKTDTHGVVLSTQYYTTTGSNDDQTSGMDATKPFMAAKSTSGHRAIPSSSGNNDKTKIWIIFVSVLVPVVVLLIMVLICLWYTFRHRRGPGPEIHLKPIGAGRDNDGHRPDADEIDVVRDAAGQENPEAPMPNAEDKVVTTQQLQTLSTNLGAEWEQLNYELGFTRAQLYHFKANHPNNVQQAIFEMLDTWRENKGQEATIDRLVEHIMKIQVDVETYGFLLSCQLS
ncbi:immunoglobulin superfamily member 10-like [Branchiostoma lanceolatum]|uniref:immunoglobulin superfamily member 10-like n=1 Tax=Branchiostoma lanceolatum TaxID=7740 RepID=UPI003453E770